MNNIYRKIPYMVLVAVSFLLVLFCTSLSPLRDAGYITHDASVFYVVGRGLKAGLVPYKDLFDHKGIYIYFLYYIASLINEEYMAGVYLVYSICVSIFAIYIYKISLIYTKRIFVAIFTSITLMMLSVTMYFSHGALHAEYIALVTITISIYLMIKYIESENNVGFPAKYMFINGILAGINIFCKFNYTLYFLSIALYVLFELLFAKKNIKLLFKNILFGILGLIVGMAPCVIYCIATNSISDMIFGTFIFNFIYANELSIDLPKFINSKIEAFFYTIKVFAWPYLIIIFSIIILSVKKIKIRSFYILSLLCLTIAVLTPMNGYTHYLSVMLPFLTPCILELYFLIDKYIIGEKKLVFIKRTLIYSVYIFLILMISYFFGYKEIENYFASNSQASLEINKSIRERVKTKKNIKLFNYGIGVYYYNYFYVIPEEKYFYIPSIKYEKFEESYDAQFEAIKSLKYDIVIYSVIDTMDKKKVKEASDFLYANYQPIFELNKRQRTVFVKKEVLK